MAIEKLYLTDTFRVWAEKFNATIDASNTATANAEKAIKKAEEAMHAATTNADKAMKKAEEALQKAEQAVNDGVKGDDITTIVNKERQVVAKDVAIGGNPKDLASARGIFQSKPVGAVDYNTLLNQGFYVTYGSGSTNGPTPYRERRIIVLSDKPNDDDPIQVTFTNNIKNKSNMELHIRNKSSETNEWTEWVKFISETDLATNTTHGIVQPDNTTITIQDGIISAKTTGTLDGTTVVKNDFNNLTTAGRYFVSTVKDTTTNAPINVTADWWIDVFTYGNGSTKKIIQEARMHSTTSSSATSGVANYLARCCTGTTWGPWEYAYTQFAG